jgi:putative hemolysin
MLLEIVLLVLLIAANGLFAMSEMAIVSSRKARLQEIANAGSEKARAALQLANNPDGFLATVQVGITLIGVLAGAFGGATIAEQISAQMQSTPILSPYSEAIGLGIVVLVITYASLIFGELVPKRLALNNPEGVAAAIARPMTGLALLASPFVRLLNVSTRAVLKLLNSQPSTESPVSEAEIRVLLEQGTSAGVFKEAEQDLVESVFRFADQRVSSLMTPRLDIVWLDINASEEEIFRTIAESHFSRFPVCRGTVDEVIGMIKAKEYLAGKLLKPTATLHSFITQPLYVPDTVSAIAALELFKRSHTHMALIIDEYGSLEGVVTTNDVLEGIVGDVVSASAQSESYATRREDGSWLVDAGLTWSEFKEMFAIGESRTDDTHDFQTLAGFILTFLGRIPAAGEHFDWHGLRLEIVDMDGRRIDKVLVIQNSETSPSMHP